MTTKFNNEISINKKLELWAMLIKLRLFEKKIYYPQNLTNKIYNKLEEKKSFQIASIDKNYQRTVIKIPKKESMLKYGSDKPDLRIPIEISDVTDIFKSSEVKLEIFKKQIKKNSIVRAIPVKNVKDKSRSFFDNLNEWAKSEGADGLAYISLVKSKESFKAFGPIGKYFSEKALNEIKNQSYKRIGNNYYKFYF